tara:strand:- start:543 stop:1811 length:1269 start_codon:yes stop_codon:yes gene_type:complete
MKKISAAIIGLGYVGLPLAVLLRKKKIKVFGFDSNEKNISKIKKGHSYISDLTNKEVSSLKNENFYNLKDIRYINKVDFIIICLPTPLRGNSPNMDLIKSALKLINPYLRFGQSIILESSVYPGATREIFYQTLSKKFELGKNFYLSHSPERLDPGKSKKYKKTTLEYIPKLISGYSSNCLKKVRDFYKKIFKKLHDCESLEVAEFAKLFENTYRSVNISLVNEIKMFASKMDINFHNVIEAAGTKPFGYTKFIPGPGTGGHCIPIDPIFISWTAKKFDFKTKFIDLSTNVNKQVSLWTISKIKNYLKKIKKNSKILIFGLTYKKDVNDLRESASLKIFEKLTKSKNFKFDYCDSYVASILINKKKFYSIKLNYKKLFNYDVIIILTDHTNLNYSMIYKYSKKIIDTRGIFKNKPTDKVYHI